MTTERPAWNVRSLLQRAEKTDQSLMAEVKPLRSWDSVAAQVHKTRTYLVQTQAEEHRREIALSEIRAELEQAQLLHDEAKRQFAAMANDVLGIGLAESAKDKRIDTLLEQIERETD